MASGTEQLREQAVQQYGAEASEVEGMDNEALTTLVLGKFAQKEYKVDSSTTEGKDKRGMIELLVKSMVSDVLKKDSNDITPETSFKDLGADSLDMVELLMRIEDVVRLFGETKIDDADAEIDTVGEAVDKIEQYIDRSVNAAA
jgi:acyl carrier protein